MPAPAHPPQSSLTRRTAALLCLWIAACGGGDSATPSPSPDAAPAPAPAPGPAPGPAPAPGTPLRAETFATGLSGPWGMAFLPDGRVLVTQRAGQLRLVSADGATVTTIAVSLPGGLDTSGQGGLLDVTVDPDFSNGQPWVYLSYSQPGTGGAGTAVMRGQLSLSNPTTLTSPTQIFEQLPKVGGGGHYGSRLVFANDKTLFITLGERQLGSPAQDLNSHLGKVVRINRDGTLPSGNPTFGTTQRPGIWSYGHRNPQGAALHPGTGELWVSEHGPQGGDEINIARAGQNYGWPNVSYGCNYGDSYPGTDNTSCRIGGNGGVHAPAFVEPLTYWVPVSIAPSGMAFYNGTLLPEWNGNLFMGALVGSGIRRLTLAGNTISNGRGETLYTNLGRVRDVAQGPDGALYILSESNSNITRVRR